MASTSITTSPSNTVVRTEANPIHVVLALLAFSAFISYVDRGNLSVAAPMLKDDLGISASQLGILLSSFYWSYTALNFASGWVVDRFRGSFVLAVGYLVWSLATVATGFVHGLMALVMMRLVLGLGESVTFPAYSKILARCLPEHRRGMANGILMASIRWGSAAVALGGGLLMARYGWRAVFIGIGLISLPWLPLWRRWAPEDSGPVHSSAPARGYAAVLKQRYFWGASFAQFCCNYFLYFMVTWLPFYLVRERHLSTQAMAKMAALYYLVDATSSIATGLLTDKCIRCDFSVTLVRKFAMFAGWATAALGLAGCSIADSHSYLPWLIVAGIGCGMGSASIFPIVQTLAGPSTAGTWTGLQNGIGNFAGILAPAVTGWTVDLTGNFHLALVITAGVSLVSAICWVFFVGEIKEVE